MADSSTLTANIITNAVDSSGATVISIVQTDVTQSSRVDATTTTGGVGPTGATGAIGTPGAPGAAGNVWTPGVPVEAPNGARTLFTIPSAYVTANILVYLNGLRETLFTETTATSITFSSAPFTTDTITLFYRTS